MAIITTSAPFDLLSGAFANRISGAGVVANPTSNRNIMRRYLKPTNPDTSFQTFVRSNFTAAAQNFTNLSASQKQGWADAAAAINRDGRLGLPYTLQAINFFISVNTLRLLDGAAQSLDAPPVIILPAPASVTTFETDGSTIDLDFAAAAGAPVGTKYLVRSSPAIPSATRNGRLNEVRLIDTVEANSLVDSNAVSFASPRFTPVDGTFRALQIQTISPDYVLGQSLFLPRVELTEAA